MRTVVLAVLGGAALLAPCVAAAQEDMIATLFAKSEETYGEHGFKPTGWTKQGTLAKGDEVRLAVTFSGSGSNFQLVGMCDEGCEDLDIQLLDASGKEVDKDDSKDDFPIVGTTSAGTYTARVKMVSCAASSCAYGVKAFVK